MPPSGLSTWRPKTDFYQPAAYLGSGLVALQ